MKSITKEELNKCKNIISKIRKNYSNKIISQENLLKSILISLMSNSHILIESVPGLAKTTAAKTISEIFNLKFSRIQCTPDLLPSDIIGTQIFNYKNNNFETRIGPINSNFILLDEINRLNPRTQSATLEAMQEKQITIDNKTYKLPDIFIVIATQNPIEEDGIYPITGAQLDRFLIKELISYPTKEEEFKILDLLENNNKNKGTIPEKELKYLQDITDKVYIDKKIKQYIVEIIHSTRKPNSSIELGSSPRGSISFMKASKALALINGRDYVTPDDIKDLRYLVLRHRITTDYSIIESDKTIENIIDSIFERIDTP